jgi:hypothetical protein
MNLLEEAKRLTGIQQKTTLVRAALEALIAARLPFSVPASNEEVLALLEQNRLFGRGLGWVDAHLPASARLTRCRLWTLDNPLRDAAKALKIDYSAVM